MNDKITQQLKKNNHILLYQQDLLGIYKNHEQKSVYIISPKEGKSALEKILKTQDENAEYKNTTINHILNEIRIHKTDEVHVFVDRFEQLTKRELSYYMQLFEMGHVSLIVNITSDNAEFIDHDFIKQFIILDDEFYENRSESINIKFTLLILLSLFIFLIFLKLQLSIINIVVSTLWFTFLMYRSFYYVMH